MRTLMLFVASQLLFAVELLPGSALAAGKSATCYDFLTSGNYERAIESGAAALRKDPKDVDASMCLGIAFRQSGDLLNALKILKMTENISTKASDIYNVANHLGQCYEGIGDYQEALRQYQRALSLAKQYKYEIGIGISLNNIANIYEYYGQFDHALKLREESLRYDAVRGKGIRYVNIADLYCKMGSDRCFEYYGKAIDDFEHSGDYHNLGITHLKLGNAFRRLEDFRKAEQELTDGLIAIKKVGDRYWEATAYAFIGWFYRDTKKISDARSYLEKAAVIFDEIGAKADADTVRESLTALKKDFQAF